MFTRGTAAAGAVVALGLWVISACAPPPPPAASCDPNYTGACVPIDVDVDCSTGGGDGPSYVVGPVTVVGTDIYGLDHDGNGIGCENG